MMHVALLPEMKFDVLLLYFKESMGFPKIKLIRNKNTESGKTTIISSHFSYYLIFLPGWSTCGNMPSMVRNVLDT